MLTNKIFMFDDSFFFLSLSHHVDPSVEVISLVKSTAELPCDVTTNDPDDQVRLVLWYKGDGGTPIYR